MFYQKFAEFFKKENNNFHHWSSELNLENQFFYLKPTNHEIILKLIEEINPAKAAGFYQIVDCVLKNGAMTLASTKKNQECHCLSM